MNKMFDVSNAKGQGHWIVAKDKDHAVTVAKGLGLIRKKHHVSSVPCSYGMKGLLKSGKFGHVALSVPAIKASDLFADGRKQKSKWIFLREYEEKV